MTNFADVKLKMTDWMPFFLNFHNPYHDLGHNVMDHNIKWNNSFSLNPMQFTALNDDKYLFS